MENHDRLIYTIPTRPTSSKRSYMRALATQYLDPPKFIESSQLFVAGSGANFGILDDNDPPAITEHQTAPGHSS